MVFLLDESHKADLWSIKDCICDLQKLSHSEIDNML